MKKLILLLLLSAAFAQQSGNSTTAVASNSTEVPVPSSSTELPVPSNSTEAPVPPEVPTTTLESTTAEQLQSEAACIGKCPAVDSYNSVYLTHQDCDKFCQCSNGQAYVIVCPGNLLFNPELDVCDWPYAVNCTSKSSTVKVEAAVEVTELAS